ncbi:MAG: hypothetical protein IT303_00540 [Dehalococcoidia bacterium]|nr:hypothetical protein [Dehalococcoidia bacterium]
MTSQLPRDFDQVFGMRPRRPAAPAPATETGRGRKLGQADHGTTALAISTMSMYWLMPMLMAKKRRRRPAAPPPPEQS